MITAKRISCTSCEPKIVLPVLQCKTKAISRSQLVQNTKNNKDQNQLLKFEETMDLSRMLYDVIKIPSYFSRDIFLDLYVKLPNLFSSFAVT